MKRLLQPPYKPATLLLLAALLFMIPVTVFAAPLVQELPPPVEGTQVHEIALFIASAIIGVFGTGIVQVIKKYTGIEDKWALLITYGVSLVVAIVELVIIGWFAPEMLTAENIPLLFGAVFSGATAWFKFLVKPKEEPAG